MSKKKRACDAAVEVLRETDNPAVSYDDWPLLGLIAAKLGWDGSPRECADRVVAALAKTPGPLAKGLGRAGNNRRVRVFRLPEQETDGAAT